MSFTSFRGDPGNDADTTPDDPAVVGGFGGEHVLVPLLTAEVPALTDQVTVATTLARATGASLSVVNPMTAPGQAPREYRHEVSDSDDAALLEWVFEQSTDSPTQLNGDFYHARDVVTGVLRAVRTHDVDTLVVPSGSRSDRLRKGAIEQVAAHADCDVVVVNGKSGIGKVVSILLPVAGGPHTGLAADVARSVAADSDAWIDVLHVVEEDASERRRERAQALVEDTRRRIGRPETTTTWVKEADDAAEAIVDQSRYYGLAIIGAPTKGRLRRLIFGSTNRSVRANAGSVVLSARNNSHRPSDG